MDNSLLLSSNGAAGIEIQSSGNYVGPSPAGGPNTIAGNANEGVLISGNNNIVAGNDIGVNDDEYGDPTLDIGNLVGVRLVGSATGNVIGGASSGQGNTIDFNGVGVSVEGSAVNNSILSNSIRNNILLGIDLNDDVVRRRMISATQTRGRIIFRTPRSSPP